MKATKITNMNLVANYFPQQERRTTFISFIKAKKIIGVNLAENPFARQII